MLKSAKKPQVNKHILHLKKVQKEGEKRWQIFCRFSLVNNLVKFYSKIALKKLFTEHFYASEIS